MPKNNICLKERAFWPKIPKSPGTQSKKGCLVYLWVLLVRLPTCYHTLPSGFSLEASYFTFPIFLWVKPFLQFSHSFPPFSWPTAVWNLNPPLYFKMGTKKCKNCGEFDLQTPLFLNSLHLLSLRTWINLKNIVYWPLWSPS